MCIKNLSVTPPHTPPHPSLNAVILPTLRTLSHTSRSPQTEALRLLNISFYRKLFDITFFGLGQLVFPRRFIVMGVSVWAGVPFFIHK